LNSWTKNEDFEQCADGIKKSAQFDYMRNETDRRFHLDTNLTSSFGRQEVTEIQKKKNTSRCLKITEKVSFNIASEASYLYILLKMPKIVYFGEFLKTWSLRSNSVTGQVNFNRTKIGEKFQNAKNSNATFWVIFEQCADEYINMITLVTINISTGSHLLARLQKVLEISAYTKWRFTCSLFIRRSVSLESPFSFHDCISRSDNK